MKKVWKWIIGIVLALIVLALLVGTAWMVRGNFHAYRVQSFDSRGFSQRGPEMMPFGGYQHMRGSGMMGYGLSPFGGFIRGLVPLGFLTLVVLGIVWLVRSLRTPKPVEPPVVTPLAMPETIANSCKKCGKSIQAEWKVCPYCGKKV